MSEIWLDDKFPKTLMAEKNTIRTILLWEIFRNMPNGEALTLEKINTRLELIGVRPFGRKAFYRHIDLINSISCDYGWKIIRRYGRCAEYIKDFWRYDDERD